MGSPVTLPAAQSVQAVDASLSSSTVPDAQSMQESVPAAAYLPTKQLWQPWELSGAPYAPAAAAMVPAAQSVQPVDESLSSSTWPAAQGVHDPVPES